ncbi:PhoH family protein [Pseudohalocynthiibacter aestuariivivens]|jgi:phosphate starvation-inducible protein PhoH and related proteins|nr:PhoH family protein [Pseudohalocynthiibacter aestuariivivens]
MFCNVCLHTGARLGTIGLNLHPTEIFLDIRALTPPPNTEEAEETLLEFPDNRLLIDLCGEFDKNLTQIEEKLSVQILRRGNLLAVLGESGAREKAAEVLQALYVRLEAGQSFEPGDIDGEIRMGDSEKDTGIRDGDQLEMFRGGRVEINTRKKTIVPRTEAQNAYVQALYQNEMAFGIGPAGTGKTYLAVAVGVSMFIGGHVDRIILSRPAVEAGERLGFLPGDMKEKVDPFMQPLYDALADFLPGKQVAKLIEDKRIEIAPLAFMRGRTLSNAFVVLDEAQNATTMQMKMFLTRLGEGSRMVITGDRSQVDLPRGVTSGLHDAERLLKDIDSISFNYFTAKDVVRHPLIAKIIEAYDRDDARL